MNKKRLLVLFLMTGMFFSVFSNNAENWDFSVVTEFAYNPKAEAIAGSTDSVHYAPLTGIYSALGARVVGMAQYTIPVPFSDHFLFSGNTLKFDTSFGISPVTANTSLGITFMPIAFLEINTGISVGSGWSLMGIPGLASWNSTDKQFNEFVFNAACFETWIQGSFMFDLAALFPGDWNHIVTLNTFKASYNYITKGGENGNPWIYQCGGEKGNPLMYQCGGEKYNAWSYYASFIFGYQMPLVLQTIGIQTELEGYFGNPSNDSFASINPEFMGIHIGPVAILEFNKQHSLTIQMRFSSRRAFAETIVTKDDYFNATYTGREFFFDRLGLQYTYNF